MNTEIIVYAVVLALFLLNVMQYITSKIERRDLYNRIMSKDINEYKRIDEEPKESIKSAHKKAIDKWRHIE